MIHDTTNQPLPSHVNAQPDKKTLRRTASQRLSELSIIEQSQHADAIAPHLLSATAHAPPATILAYAAFAPELSLDPFIHAALLMGVRIAIPSIDWTRKSMSAHQISNLDADLTPGRYDIRVPRDGCALVEPEQIDVIFLPGLAFDRAGNRLGRGAGFYDRYVNALKDSGHNPTLIGVCHHAQIVDSVPTDPHDHRVDRVITELGPLDPV